MDLLSSLPSQYDESRMNESRMNFENNKVDEKKAIMKRRAEILNVVCVSKILRMQKG